MRKLILIKHAAPLVIPGTPPEKWKLSDKGRESIAPLAEALRPHAPAVVVTSEEPKARETGELLAQALGIPFETAAGLHEHDRSNVPHMRSGEFISHVEVFFRKPTERVLGRESAVVALDRFEAAVNSVIAKHAGGNIAIVSHGTVIALLAAEHSDRYGFELWREMGLPSVAVLELPSMELEQVVAKV
jgi:broad specificity phosphatase PhoE